MIIKQIIQGIRWIVLPIAMLNPVASRGNDNEAYVVQTDLETQIAIVIPLAADGGPFVAAAPVSETGSLFELWARGTAWDDNIYLLDSQVVGAFTPTVDVTLESIDPYFRGNLEQCNYVKRTRADHPFSFAYEISGLVPQGTPNATQAETSVRFTVGRRAFDPEEYSQLDEEPEELIVTSLYNSNENIGAVYHELSLPWSQSACGEHTFLFERRGDDGLPDTPIAHVKLEVWPVATAAIHNLEPNAVYIDRIPSTTLDLAHLYPDSRTYAQIYRGAAGAPEGDPTLLGATERRFGRHYNPEQPEPPTEVPQNAVIQINDLSNYTPTDGTYTLEVRTETPFSREESELLATVTFEVDRLISSRGQLITAEDSDP